MSSLVSNYLDTVNTLWSQQSAQSSGSSESLEAFESSMNDFMQSMSATQLNSLNQVACIDPVAGAGTAYIAPSGGALHPESGASFAQVLNDVSSDAASTTSKSSLEDRFSVLNQGTKAEDWAVLEGSGEASDFSILDTLGDGLMTALKFAANAYIGKII